MVDSALLVHVRSAGGLPYRIVTPRPFLRFHPGVRRPIPASLPFPAAHKEGGDLPPSSFYFSFFLLSYASSSSFGSHHPRNSLRLSICICIFANKQSFPYQQPENPLIHHPLFTSSLLRRSAGSTVPSNRDPTSSPLNHIRWENPKAAVRMVHFTPTSLRPLRTRRPTAARTNRPL